MGHGIIIQLTVEQQEAVAPIMRTAKKHGDDGKPGMVLAQVYPSHMDVGFVPYEMARIISAASTGKDDEVLIKSASDKISG